MLHNASIGAARIGLARYSLARGNQRMYLGLVADVIVLARHGNGLGYGVAKSGQTVAI